ncbi:MAG: hypothetical protein EAZ95_06210 [Bacteroidetes bacterium]|nr:MAG: hypothetical protein EAZ95_06210 [Bacteroidota bacterium]
MKKIFFAILLWHCSLTAQAQYQAYIASMKQAFAKATTVEQKREMLQAVMDSVRAGGNKHTRLKAKQEAYLAFCEHLETQVRAKPTYKSLMPEVLMLFTHFYSRHHDSKTHLEYAYKTVELAKQYNNKEVLRQAYGYLCDFYYGNGQHDKALPLLLETAKIIEGDEALEKKAQFASLLNVIAISYAKLKQYELSTAYFEKALRVARKYNDVAWIGLSYGNMSMVNEAKGDYRQAITFLKQDVRYSLLAKNPSSAVNAWVFIADLHGRLKEYKQGSLALDSAWALLKKLTKQDSLGGINIKWIYTKAYKFYKESKQYEKLPLYTDSLLSFSEKDSHRKFQAEMENIHTKYGVKLKEQEITLLQKQKSTERRVLYLTAVIALCMVALAVVLFTNNRRQLKINTLLNEKQEEIETQNEELNTQKEQLAYQNEALQQLNTTKDKLFSIVSHDFRSPLNALKSTAYLMSREDISPAEVKELTTNVATQINHTSYFLENLLFWAKSQLKGFRTEAERFDLQELVQENIELAYPQAEQKKIILEAQNTEKVWIMADKNMTRLVLRNLLSNALKYGRQADRVTLAYQRRQDHVLITIQDTGLGMNTEQMRAIFTPYISSTYGTHQEKGAGLGLLLCKDFVERNGGEIWAESEAGKGSTFYFTLPLATADETPHATEEFLVEKLADGAKRYRL